MDRNERDRPLARFLTFRALAVWIAFLGLVLGIVALVVFAWNMITGGPATTLLTALLQSNAATPAAMSIVLAHTAYVLVHLARRELARRRSDDLPVADTNRVDRPALATTAQG